MKPSESESSSQKKRSRSSSEASGGKSSKRARDEQAAVSSTKEPFLVNVVVNLLMTFALSLSIYLLIANILLTVHKFSYQSSTSRFNFVGDRSPVPGGSDGATHLGASAFDQVATELNAKDGGSHKKYYDCSTSILSIEECNQINMYHDEYLHLVKMALASGSALSSSAKNYDYLKKDGSKAGKPNLVESNSNFKVNTSLYIR